MQFFSRHAAIAASIVLGVIITVSLTLYLNGGSKGKPPGDAAFSAAPDAAHEGLKNFVRFAPPRPVADISFDLLLADGQAQKAGLDKFRGALVVVNFWATWCAPCRREMPLFDALQAHYKDAPVRVVALALDRGAADKPRKFLSELNITHLTQAHDPSYASARAVGLIGLPTTLVLDATGKEIGRLAGEADWNGPDVHAIIDAELEKMATGG
ncbi:MAG: Thiol:disulfide interchange protein TlpA [Rhodobiaceae bacterium UBA7378]|nr:MAG: Thiol:disulfide interchange protein TlpA [Rhodobiaceae bacterium UBA7378]